MHLVCCKKCREVGTEHDRPDDDDRHDPSDEAVPSPSPSAQDDGEEEEGEEEDGEGEGDGKGEEGHKDDQEEDGENKLREEKEKEAASADRAKPPPLISIPEKAHTEEPPSKQAPPVADLRANWGKVLERAAQKYSSQS